MTKLLAVGSVAFDSVKTPLGEAMEILGGSATYFCTAASYFTEVQMIAVVGEDFSDSHLNILRRRGIDLAGLERRPGRTFRWRGEYPTRLNEAMTLETQLNVFETFQPTVPDGYRSPSLLFLANIDPSLQLSVLRQVQRPALVALDTMNFWIDGKLQDLYRVVKEVDVLIVNDGEAYALTGRYNLVEVARTVRDAGPRTLIVKRGEYGVVMFHGDAIFSLPAYPMLRVMDPTGAGDSFAGGFMGFLAKSRRIDEASLRQAVVCGSVMASFAIESFSVDRLLALKDEEINQRYTEFGKLTAFKPL